MPKAQSSILFGTVLESFLKKDMNKLYVSGLMFLFAFSGCDTAKSILSSVGTTNGNLTTAEVVDGLKTALRVGTDSATTKLSALDGFYKDALVKIVMPP